MHSMRWLRCVFCVVILCGLVVCQAFAETLPSSSGMMRRDSFPQISSSLKVGAGAVSYEENFSSFDTKSEWSAGMAVLEGQFRAQDRSGLMLQAEGMLWVSGKGEEEWAESGVVVQRNDMEIACVQMMGEVGYLLFEGRGVSVVPFVGLGGRGVEQDRTDAKAVGADIVEWDHAEEEISIQFINVAVEVGQEIESFDLDFRVDLGWVTHNEAYNSFLDVDIEGDGGVIFGSSVDAVWKINERHTLGLGIGYELQDLQGGSENGRFFDRELGFVPYTLEWPDNETERFWGQASWQYQF